MKENTTLNIADLLTDIGAVGRNQAILSPKLCEMIGCNSSELKAAVHTERKAGALICSDSNGYYMAENKQEIADFFHYTKAHALSRLVIIKAFGKALSDIEGQQALDDIGGAAE